MAGSCWLRRDRGATHAGGQRCEDMRNCSFLWQGRCVGRRVGRRVGSIVGVGHGRLSRCAHGAMSHGGRRRRGWCFHGNVSLSRHISGIGSHIGRRWRGWSFHGATNRGGAVGSERLSEGAGQVLRRRLTRHHYHGVLACGSFARQRPRCRCRRRVPALGRPALGRRRCLMHRQWHSAVAWGSGNGRRSHRRCHHRAPVLERAGRQGRGEVTMALASPRSLDDPGVAAESPGAGDRRFLPIGWHIVLRRLCNDAFAAGALRHSLRARRMVLPKPPCTGRKLAARRK